MSCAEYFSEFVSVVVASQIRVVDVIVVVFCFQTGYDDSDLSPHGCRQDAGNDAPGRTHTFGDLAQVARSRLMSHNGPMRITLFLLFIGCATICRADTPDLYGEIVREDAPVAWWRFGDSAEEIVSSGTHSIDVDNIRTKPWACPLWSLRE